MQTEESTIYSAKVISRQFNFNMVLCPLNIPKCPIATLWMRSLLLDLSPGFSCRVPPFKETLFPSEFPTIFCALFLNPRPHSWATFPVLLLWGDRISLSSPGWGPACDRPASVTQSAEFTRVCYHNQFTCPKNHLKSYFYNLFVCIWDTGIKIQVPYFCLLLFETKSW